MMRTIGGTVLATLSCFLISSSVVSGLRLGEDEQAAAPAANSILSGNETKKLQKWFKDNKLPSGDQEKMDGSVNDPIWDYMKSDCFQGRYRTAAKEILKQGCGFVIEIGGYLTPLDKFLLEAVGGGKVESKGKGSLLEKPKESKGKDGKGKDGKGKDGKGKDEKKEEEEGDDADSLAQKPKESKGKEGKGEHGKAEGGLPKMYINIDPSMPEAKASEEKGMKILHLPMTLADFFSDEAKSLREEYGLEVSRKDSCTLAFGIWDPHYKTKEDENAILKLYKNVKFAAAETSDYAKNWLKKTEKVAKEAGLKLLRDEDADCIEELKGQKPDTSILRHIKFFVSGEGKEGKDGKKGA